MQSFRYPPLTPNPGDKAVEEVLREIAVPQDQLTEAKKRRNLVCDLALEHEAARAVWYSGSIAHGTHNAPLGDADCGVMVDRRSNEFRAYGPDAGPGGLGPEGFIRSFAEAILPRLRERGYPDAQVDLSGNRAIKFEFNDPVAIDELGEIDPPVDLIVGLDRREAPGIWIPNRRRNGWDAANPQKHTELMTERDPQDIVVHRAHLIRLVKRAIKRDALSQGVAVMCSWNVSAIALSRVDTRGPLASSLAAFLTALSHDIAAGLTDDPAHVAGPISLPDGMTNELAASRLQEMANVVARVSEAANQFEARRILSTLFGVEIDEIRAREKNVVRAHPLNDALRSRNAAGVGAALGAKVVKPTRSHGGRRCP